MAEPPNKAGDSGTFELPDALLALLDEMARSAGVTPEEAIQKSLALLAQVEAAQAVGRRYGFVSNAHKLEVELPTSDRLVTDLGRRLKPDEHDEERRSRLTNESRGALLDDIKSFVLFIALLVGVFGVGGICVYLAVFASGVTPETQRWAQTVLAALVSGSASFLIGRKIGSK